MRTYGKDHPMSDTESLGQQLGKVMATLICRSTFIEFFDSKLPEPAGFTARTMTGSTYEVELFADGEPEEYVYSEPGFEATYLLRPGTARVNGTEVVGFVGFHLETGTLLVLNQDRRRVRRSSSLPPGTVAA